MAVEKQRGCGYRIVNKLYLVGTGVAMSCDRLNYDLHACPTCSGGVHVSRTMAYLDWNRYAGKHAAGKGCSCGEGCPVCNPPNKNVGLMLVGSRYYGTPEAFIKEALSMGISKRIPAIPKGITLGESWVFFYHPKAGSPQPKLCPDGTPQLDKSGNQIIEPTPAVFYAFKPERIEMLIWQKDATPDKLKELEKRGITPIIVPDGDVDHTKAGSKVCLQKKKAKPAPGTTNITVGYEPAEADDDKED